MDPNWTEGLQDPWAGWAVVAHAFNPSTWEAESGVSLSSRPAWSTE
jgi:major histocompatibility complex class I